jgi:hypothetical protein
MAGYMECVLAVLTRALPALVRRMLDAAARTAAKARGTTYLPSAADTAAAPRHTAS